MRWPSGMGKSEPSDGFVPWIILVGPTGVLLASSRGSVAAQINITAPTTGLYTVFVAPASNFPYGTGHYLLTVTGAILTSPPSDIVVDFGKDSGLWVRRSVAGQPPLAASWQQLHGLSPLVMANARMDANAIDDLVGTFPGFGVWALMNGTIWTQLHGAEATRIVPADLDGNGLDEIVLNLPGSGIWIYHDNGTWTALHRLNATAIAAAHLDAGPRDDLILNFTGAGVWQYLNGSTWSRIHGLETPMISTSPISTAMGKTMSF